MVAVVEVAGSGGLFWREKCGQCVRLCVLGDVCGEFDHLHTHIWVLASGRTKIQKFPRRFDRFSLSTLMAMTTESMFKDIPKSS